MLWIPYCLIFSNNIVSYFTLLFKSSFLVFIFLPLLKLYNVSFNILDSHFLFLLILIVFISFMWVQLKKQSFYQALSHNS